MAKSPAFQWYPKDIMSSERVKLLSILQEGAYRIAIDSCWLHGSVPSDPRKLSKVIGKGCSAKLASDIIHLFIVDPSDSSRLIHDRLEVEREKQIQFHEKQSENGKRGGRPKRKPNESQTKPNPLEWVKPKKALHLHIASSKEEIYKEDFNWDNEKRKFLEDSEWMSKTYTQLLLKIPDLKWLMSFFILELEVKEDYKPQKEIKKHFVAWFRKTKPNIIELQKFNPQNESSAPIETVRERHDRLTRESIQ